MIKAFIWRVRCTWHFMRIAKTGLKLGWYLAGVWVTEEFMDWQDYHPRDAVYEEISNWDNDEATA
jgi:hypothetical protein